MTHDAFRDPYGQRENAHRKRRDFEKLKTSESFKRWREYQYRMQRGLCAWCKIPLDFENIVTHVDHVIPLFHDGSNEYENFVLSCRRCNLRKWISNKYVVPQWIKDNKEKNRMKSVRKSQRKVARQIIQDSIFDDLRWILAED